MIFMNRTLKTKDKRTEVTIFLVGVGGHIRNEYLQENTYLVSKVISVL